MSNSNINKSLIGTISTRGTLSGKVGPPDSGYKRVKSDWNENDSTKSSYIENRPFYEEDGVVHQIDSKFIDWSQVEIVNPNWNENDPDNKAYIRNRPFYEESGNWTVILSPLVVSSMQMANSYGLPINLSGGPYKITDTFKIIYDDVEYILVPHASTESDFYYIGAKSDRTNYDYSDYPFTVWLNGWNTNNLYLSSPVYVSDTEVTSHTISISVSQNYVIEKLERKFLPNFGTNNAKKFLTVGNDGNISLLEIYACEDYSF